MALAPLRLAASAALFLALPAAAQDLSSGRWVDLTHPFNEASIYWPTKAGGTSSMPLTPCVFWAVSAVSAAMA